ISYAPLNRATRGLSQRERRSRQPPEDRFGARQLERVAEAGQAFAALLEDALGCRWLSASQQDLAEHAQRRRLLVPRVGGAGEPRPGAVAGADQPVQRLVVTLATPEVKGQVARQLVEAIGVQRLQRFDDRGMRDAPLRLKLAVVGHLLDQRMPKHIPLVVL